MDESIADHIFRGARRTHRDESGAIALAGLAATLILLMLALVIWDTGKAMRDKIDLQNSADVAAYSQASVKARSMNMLAFTNVAKRSVVGLQTTYVAMWLGYTDWWIEKGQECAECFGVCEPCRDYQRNLPLIYKEGWGDWRRFSGFPFPAVDPRQALAASNVTNSKSPMYDSVREDTYLNEVKALDNYQDYLVDITPWWAWTESLIRGTRNGASLTTSFPAPQKPSSTTGGWLKGALGSGGSSYSYSSGPDLHDALPVTQQGAEYKKTCEASTARSSDYPDTGAATDEFDANLAIHESRSKEAAQGAGFDRGMEYLLLGDPNPAPGTWSDPTVTRPSICEVWGYNLWGDSMKPYSYDASSNQALELLKRSNLVFSYKYTPERQLDIVPSSSSQGREAEKYDFIESDYTVGNQNNATYGARGFWSMARAEIAFARKNSTANFDADDPEVMWRAGWTARLRPVALPGEWEQLRTLASTSTTVDLKSAYHATNKHMSIARQAGLLPQGELTAESDAYPDMIFMERATRTMNGQATDGIFK